MNSLPDREPLIDDDRQQRQKRWWRALALLAGRGRESFSGKPVLLVVARCPKTTPDPCSLPEDDFRPLGLSEKT